VMSAAYDPATDSVLTVSVPNPKNRKLVVSRFDRKDMTLSEEFVLADLQRAMAALEEITGRRTTEDVLQHVFERFCIGK